VVGKGGFGERVGNEGQATANKPSLGLGLD